jgi:hypothetical protein
MKSETIPSTPTCWQREAPCACLRVETSADDVHVFPYQHLVTASLNETGESETLRLAFSSHDIEITGRNLRPLSAGGAGFCGEMGSRDSRSLSEPRSQ